MDFYGFYGCKIEKFVRDLKKLSHSYLKQPLELSIYKILRTMGIETNEKDTRKNKINSYQIHK